MMSNKTMYLLWVGLFVLCAGLGLIPSPDGALYGFLVFCAVVFFIPPAVILFRSVKAGDEKEIRRIRNFSLISLICTVVAYSLNIMSVGFSAAAGRFLYILLIIVSCPMICGQIWVLSLFLWACLLVAALQYGKKKNA